MERCSNPECAAPKVPCHIGGDYKSCEWWQKMNSPKAQTKAKQIKLPKKNLPWSGEALKIEEAGIVTARNSSIVIGVVGKADAGKTTFLAMLFTLLQKGHSLENYKFAGSKTIIGWDYLYDRLKVYQTKVDFPDPTPLEYLRMFHLALRSGDNKLRDILISDASGEVFTLWSTDRHDINAENARQIYEHSSGFILFIDCMDLIKRKGGAKAEIIKVAEMLKHDLRDRPVIAVWSKADKKDKVHPVIVQALEEELQNMYKNFTQIDISNFSIDQPDALVHHNNLKVVDWLLKNIPQPGKQPVTNEQGILGDIFLNYRGR